jgi:hypothetical protein
MTTAFHVIKTSEAEEDIHRSTEDRRFAILRMINNRIDCPGMKKEPC